MSGTEFNFEELDKAVNAAMNGKNNLGGAKRRGVNAASVSSFNGYSNRQPNNSSNNQTTHLADEESKNSEVLTNRQSKVKRGVSATSILGGPQIARKRDRLNNNKLTQKSHEDNQQNSVQSHTATDKNNNIYKNSPRPKPRPLVRKKVIMDIVPNKKPDLTKPEQSRRVNNVNVSSKNIDGILDSNPKKSTSISAKSKTSNINSVAKKQDVQNFSKKIRSIFDKNTESKLEEYKRNSLALSTKKLKPVKKQEIKLPENSNPSTQLKSNVGNGEIVKKNSQSSTNTVQSQPTDNLSTDTNAITHFTKPTSEIKAKEEVDSKTAEKEEKVKSTQKSQDNLDTDKLEKELDKIIPKSKDISKEDLNKSPFVEDAPIEKRPLGSIPNVTPINKNLVSERKIERKKPVNNQNNSTGLSQVNADFPNKVKAKSKLSNQDSVQNIFDNETHVRPKAQQKIRTPGWVWAFAAVSILVTVITVLVVLWYLEIIRF